MNIGFAAYDGGKYFANWYLASLRKHNQRLLVEQDRLSSCNKISCKHLRWLRIPGDTFVALGEVLFVLFVIGFTVWLVEKR